MVAYRRNRLKGGQYFFTVNLKNRHHSWLTDHIDFLRLAFRRTRKKYPFSIIAIVILPDHLHTIWQLPDDDDDYSTRWNFLKGQFTSQLKTRINLQKDSRGRYGVWQDRFWEHTIRDR